MTDPTLLDLMTGKFGWFTTLIIWIGALRLPLKLLQGWIQKIATALVTRVVASPEQDDDALLRRLFGSLTYRFVAFLADILLSLKLPTNESLDNHRETPAVKDYLASLLRCVLISWLGIWVLGQLGILSFSGCRSLDPAGVYHGDTLLYQADLNITTSYEVIHTFVTWEKKNRVALAPWAEIKRSADYTRANARQWFATAHALRDAYAANPTDDSRNALTRALNVLHTALTEATTQMARASGAELAPDPKP